MTTSVTNWNLAEVLSAVAERRSARPALVDARGTTSWQDFDRRTDALATLLAELAPTPQSKVAVFQRNTVEHLETYLACFKAGLVPVNVNHRYTDGELHYVLADADVEVIVVGSEFVEAARRLRSGLPLLSSLVLLDAHAAGPGEVDYESEVCRRLDRDEHASLAARRGPDDLLLIYTGGTTGHPKGVMWRQDDLFEALVVSGQQALDLPPVATVDDLVAGLPDSPPIGISASPLMHSTGLLNQLMVLLAGGTAVLLPGLRFDARELWEHVARHGVTSLAIVGDAFARPMLVWLEENPDRLNLSCLQLIVSSGAMWSDSVQEGLLRQLPQLTLYDAFGSSEGFGLGMSVRTAGQSRETARFRLGPHTRVRTDDGRWLDPGDEGVGRTAVRGVLPLGYYKDPHKTAETFVTLDGERYSVAGDYVQLHADGTVHLLGRGSACINTGGEKVFAEEVEEVLNQHPDIGDAACLGIPDARFGSVVCAVVQAHPGHRLTRDSLSSFVRTQLADYKAPRRPVVLDRLPRTALGKVDYPACRELALSELARSKTG
jgi:fatty-acyl-CoA synthase